MAARTRPMTRAVIAVVKEADIPGRTDRPQKLEQSTRPFRKFEPVEALIRKSARLTPHHVTHVQLRHLVVGHVAYGKSGVADDPDERGAFGFAGSERQAHEDLRGLRVPISIVEFSDAVIPQKFAKPQKRAGRLGYFTRTH